MAKIHVNAEGESKQCHAEKGGCPYGAERHFDNEKDAQAFAAQEMEEKYGDTGSVSKKTPSAAAKETQRPDEITKDSFEAMSRYDQGVINDYMDKVKADAQLRPMEEDLAHESESFDDYINTGRTYTNLVADGGNELVDDNNRKYLEGFAYLNQRATPAAYRKYTQRSHSRQADNDSEKSAALNEVEKSSISAQMYEKSTPPEFHDDYDREVLNQRIQSQEFLRDSNYELAAQADESSEKLKSSMKTMDKRTKEYKRRNEKLQGLYDVKQRAEENAGRANEQASLLKKRTEQPIVRNPEGKDRFGQPYGARENTMKNIDKIGSIDSSTRLMDKKDTNDVVFARNRLDLAASRQSKAKSQYDDAVKAAKQNSSGPDAEESKRRLKNAEQFLESSKQETSESLRDYNNKGEKLARKYGLYSSTMHSKTEASNAVWAMAKSDHIKDECRNLPENMKAEYQESFHHNKRQLDSGYLISPYSRRGNELKSTPISDYMGSGQYRRPNAL